MEDRNLCEYAQGPHNLTESGPIVYTCIEEFDKKCRMGYDHTGTVRIMNGDIIDVNLCPAEGYIPLEKIRLMKGDK